MTSQGAALQSYNNELVKCIDDLTNKLETLNHEIIQEENEKQKCNSDIRLLAERLSKITQSLAQKIQMRNEMNRTLKETQAAYDKILETSQSLLNNIKNFDKFENEVKNE